MGLKWTGRLAAFPQIVNPAPGTGSLLLLLARLAHRIAHHRGELVRSEAERMVKVLRVAREQIDAAAAKVRVFEDAGEHPPSDSVAAKFLIDDEIAKVTDCRSVRDHTRKARELP